MQVMTNKVFWLFPSLKRGHYWQPILGIFTNSFPNTFVITGEWPGYINNFDGSFQVRICGQTKQITWRNGKTQTAKTLTLPSIQIMSLLIMGKADVVFTSGFNLWTAASVLCKLFCKYKLIVIYDGSSKSVDYLNNNLILLYRRIISRYFSGAITNSQKGKKYLRDFLGISDKKILAYPYQLPIAMLQDESPNNVNISEINRTTFLFLGRIIESKGVGLLLESYSQIAKTSNSQFKLIIGGDGDKLVYFTDLAKELNISDQITWMGWIPENEVNNFLSLGDIFVFPTYEDVWGVVLLEALSMGKIVICSTQAGSSELIIDGVNGFLFDPKDENSLLIVMKRVVSMGEELIEIRKNAIETIGKLSHTNSVEQIISKFVSIG